MVSVRKKNLCIYAQKHVHNTLSLRSEKNKSGNKRMYTIYYHFYNKGEKAQ